MPMEHFAAAREALNEARASLAALRARNPDQASAEKHWIAYLRALDRSWHKVHAEMRKKSTKWQGWIGRGEIEDLRKTDPLLSYLVNARGVDEHGIDPLSWRMSILKVLDVNEKADEYISRIQGIGDKISVSIDGRAFVRGVRRIAAVTQQNQLRLMRVTNRDREYEIPTMHLGNSLADIDPITVGTAGIEFYAAAIDRIEAHFFPRG